jgi:steroid delta-isomerase-like uncharacterized protein
MDANAKKQTVKRYYDEVWCGGEVGVVDQLMSPGYQNCDPATPGGTIEGRDAFKAFVASYREAFPDLRLDIQEQWCEGDTVISRWLASGTHRGALAGLPPSGKQATGIVGVTLTDFEGGKIVRDRAVWDFAGLLRALGAMPS